jgi:phosphate transport system substrate-binding protein
MAHRDVVYPEGVEKDVADQANAIGFATLRPRTAKVRALAVAANSGEPAYRTTADDIYSGKYPLQRKFYAYVAAPSLKEGGDFSRELMNLLLSDVGQTLVARGGSLPLMASEVIAERKKLDLP